MRLLAVFSLLFGFCLPAVAETRKLLTGPLVLRVSMTGNDSSDCEAAACATLSRAVRVLQTSYDLGCQKVTIQIDAGNGYEGMMIYGPLVGQCASEDFAIHGDELSPTSRVFSSGITGKGGARFFVQGVTIGNAAGNALGGEDGGTVVYGRNIYFGQVSGDHIYAGVGARTKMVGNYAIFGGARAHISSSGQGQTQINNGVIVSLFNNPTFSYFALSIEGGLLNAASVKWVGSGTAACRFAATFNGVIYTGEPSLTYFPVTPTACNGAEGQVFSGGQYG